MKRQAAPLVVIIAMNLIPVYGMFFLGWTIFSILYFYWFETLVITAFQALKIGYAGKKMINEKNNRAKIIFSYLFFRLGMFFFYLLFIFVFVGMVVANREEMLTNIKMFFFLDRSFNLAILGMILSYGFQFTFQYLLEGEYKLFSPDDLNNVFDFRTIVMHVVIVLGGVSYGFLQEKGMSARMGTYTYLGLFILLKTAYDLFTYKSGRAGMKSLKEEAHQV